MGGEGEVHGAALGWWATAPRGVPAGGTRLRMEQEGFRPDQKQAFGGAHAGWKQFLDKLDGLLAKEG